MIKTCTFCPRNCKALRTNKEGFGFCKMPSVPAVCRAALHFGEEPVISGKNGSGAIFFSGCVLKCCYCQNFEISRTYCGRPVTPNELSEMIKKLEAEGAENINLVTPTHFADSCIKALEIYKPSIPVVYNCGGYESVDTLKRLEGLIDVYLPDFKYADKLLSAEFSSAPDYPEKAKSAIAEMYRQTGYTVIKNGIMQSGVLVRHLVLPSALKNSYAVMDEIYDIFGDKAYVSLMRQFTPNGECRESQLDRRVTTYEYEKVKEYMIIKGIVNGFCQDRSSATDEMLPVWDLK